MTTDLLERLGVTRRGRNLVLTAADDGGLAMLSASAPLMFDYATRHGADFKIIAQSGRTDTALPRPHAVKFYAARELDSYERVLWLDADCLVSPHAPSLFTEVPASSKFAAWCDEGLEFAGDALRRPAYRHGYFNSGVFIAADPAPFPVAMTYLVDKATALTPLEQAAIMGEQTPLNKAVHTLGIDVHPLGAEWNFIKSAKVRLEQAYIIHCAGGGHLSLRNPRDRAERAVGMHELRRRLGW